MRIKHWQGYGVVNAVRTKDKNFSLCVTVSGNHEWGLYRNDMYDLFRWLIQKFDKEWKDKPYTEFAKLRPEVYIARWDYEGEEHCQYKFRYRK